MTINNDKDSLENVMASLQNRDEVAAFLKDLLTPQEAKALQERWLIARRLDQGEMSYRAISAETGASVTTITRVARFLKDEPYKGYRIALDRIKAAGPQNSEQGPESTQARHRHS